MTEDKMREAFEEWFERENGYPAWRSTEPGYTDTYDSPFAQGAWMGYQAALAAHPQPREGWVSISPTQQNVLLVAAETLDDLGAPLNAKDIRLILSDTATKEEGK